MQAFLSLCIYFLLFQPREITFLHFEAAGRTQTGHNFSHHRPKVTPHLQLPHSLKNHSPLSGKVEEEGDREEERKYSSGKVNVPPKPFPLIHLCKHSRSILSLLARLLALWLEKINLDAIFHFASRLRIESCAVRELHMG